MNQLLSETVISTYQQILPSVLGYLEKGRAHYEEIGEDADKRNYVVSYDKISSLGFTTSINVEQGIDEVIQALKVTDFQNKYTNARYY